MGSAQCQKMRKGAINCFVVSLDSELAMSPDFDLKPIRKAVADLIESLQKH